MRNAFCGLTTQRTAAFPFHSPNIRGPPSLPEQEPLWPLSASWGSVSPGWPPPPSSGRGQSTPGGHPRSRMADSCVVLAREDGSQGPSGRAGHRVVKAQRTRARPRGARGGRMGPQPGPHCREWSHPEGETRLADLQVRLTDAWCVHPGVLFKFPPWSRLST